MKLVSEFHAAFGLPAYDEPFMPDIKRVQLRWKLLNEEHQEVSDELVRISRRSSTRYEGLSAYDAYSDIARLAKELADLRYVIEGCALEFGIPLDDVYAEVHRSNMSKLGPDGRPIRRHDGKVLKGPNYREANVLRVLGIIDSEGTAIQ